MSEDGHDQSPPPSPPPVPPAAPPPPSPPAPSYGAPASGPPPGYPPSSYGATPTRTEGFAIAALVLGIVSLFLFIMVVPAILAIVFGLVALSRIKREPALKGKGLAVGGIVTGALGLLGMIVFIVVVAIAGTSETKISKSRAERFVSENLNPKAESVVCPEGVTAKANITFECQVSYADGDNGTVTVHVRNSDGDVTVGPGDLHRTKISRSKAERFVKGNLNPRADSVICPDGVASRPDTTFECQVSYADGDRGTVTVHITDDQGNVTVGPGDLHIQR